MIPQGWQEKTLVELCNIEIGKTPSRSNIKFWDKTRSTNNTWLSIADLNNTQNKKVFSSKEQISDLATQYMKLVKEGTLLLSFKLTIGRVAFAGKDLYTNEAIAQLPIKNEQKIDKHYLYYYLQYFDYEELLKGDVKVKGKTLNKEKLKGLPVCYPPLPEQERIVAKLDKAFEAIDKVKANAEQNLNNAKELFNDAQTTIFNEPFEEKKLGDICTLYQGLAINMKTKHLLCDKSTLPLLRIKDLKENCETQYVVEEGFPKNALVNESDIIYTRTGSLGLVFRGRKGVLHNNSFKVVPQKNISNDYLFEWLQNPIFNKKIVSLAQRAAQPDITHTLFKQQIINVPPFEIQLKKVKQINVIREYINTLNQIYTKKIKDLDELKQSILQKAFRGEL